jgi:hypothetical protein
MIDAILSGGANGGKTYYSWVFSLNATTVPEAAMQVVTEVIERKGLVKGKEWMRSNWAELYLRMAKRQLKLEATHPANGHRIRDRSVVDYESMAINRDIPVHPYILEAQKRWNQLMFSFLRS